MPLKSDKTWVVRLEAVMFKSRYGSKRSVSAHVNEALVVGCGHLVEVAIS